MIHRRQAHAEARQGPEIVEREARDALVNGEHQEVIRILVDGYGLDIYRSCLVLVRDAALAEDVQQEVFLDAYEALLQFDLEKRFLPWLRTIAIHRCLDELKVKRRRERRIVASDPLPDTTDLQRSSEEVLTYTWLAHALVECVDRLPQDMHDAVMLHFFEGMSYVDMAGVLKEPDTTLQARVKRCLIILRRCMHLRGIDV